MRERIRKELRYYRPYVWAVGALLIASLYLRVLLETAHFPEFLRNLLIIASWSLLGTISMGNECSFGTMSQMIAQGISRRRIWYEKLLVQGLLILIFTVFYWLYFALGAGNYDQELMWLLLAGPYLALTTGPMFVLLLRNTLAAMLFSVITPFLLVLVVSLFLPSEIDQPELMQASALVAYGAIAYLGGCYLLRNYQDYNRWSRSLDLSLGWPLFRLSGFFGSYMPGKERLYHAYYPILSLIRKELHLQQMTWFVTLIGVAVFFLIYSFRERLTHPSLDPRFLLIALVWLACILNSMMSGIIAFAEEKHWGITDWHLTFPVSVAKQWYIKVITSHLVSGVVGIVIPLLFYRFILWKLPESRAAHEVWYVTGISMVFCNLIVTSISLFTSSLSKTTAQAALLSLFVLGSSLWILTQISSPWVETLQREVWVKPFRPSLFLVFIACWFGTATIHYNVYERRQEIWLGTLSLIPALILLGCVLSIGMLALFRATLLSIMT